MLTGSCLGEVIERLMSGELNDLFAVAACSAVVAIVEAVTIPLLRRSAPAHIGQPTYQDL
jgi:hypothetical protein